jgi:serine/threonine-protein kinase GIN4
VPVLVDFGFAEKYDLEDESAFRSNLTYGTPEVSFFLLLVYMH